jgi:hypothetical protein
VTRFLIVLFTVLSVGIAGCASTPNWGKFSEAEIAAWKENGFTSKEAKDWSGKGIDAASAGAWRDGGFTSSEARKWATANFSAEEARKWKDGGFSLSKAKQSRKKGLSPVAEGA